MANPKQERDSLKKKIKELEKEVKQIKGDIETIMKMSKFLIQAFPTSLFRKNPELERMYYQIMGV